MLGIRKTYDAETGVLKQIAAKNDCNFDYHCAFKNGGELPPHLWEGFASLGMEYKDNPVHCREKNIRVVFEIYKSCNDEKPMFVVEITGDGVVINENIK